MRQLTRIRFLRSSRFARGAGFTRVEFAIVNIIVFGIIFCVFWHFNEQRKKDQKESINQFQYLVQAIVDYKATYGLVPDSLEDLVPDFLDVVPDDWRVALSSGRIVIRKRLGELDHSVAYSFLKKNEGWDVPGYPIVRPTRPVASGNELIDVRLNEFDRCIAMRSLSDSLGIRTVKVAYLISLDRPRDAASGCEFIGTIATDWWWPQYGLAVLADAENALIAAKRFNDWVEASPSFLNYYFLARYYREEGRVDDALASLRKGAQYTINDPIDHNPTNLCGPDGFALEAAMFANEQRDYSLSLKLCERLSTLRSYHSMDYCAFQAAAHLGLGNTAEAKSIAELAVESSRTGFGKRSSISWVENIADLRDACAKGDVKFVYDPGPTVKTVIGHWDWLAGPRARLSQIMDDEHFEANH